MIRYDKTKEGMESFLNNAPFDHCIINDFFEKDVAVALENEFLNYDNPQWHCYNNQVEVKKTLNDWNSFPPLTYRVFTELNSKPFISLLEESVKHKIIIDQGLHGGGWHIHGLGG